MYFPKQTLTNSRYNRTDNKISKTAVLKCSLNAKRTRKKLHCAYKSSCDEPIFSCSYLLNVPYAGWQVLKPSRTGYRQSHHETLKMFSNAGFQVKTTWFPFPTSRMAYERKNIFQLQMHWCKINRNIDRNCASIWTQRKKKKERNHAQIVCIYKTIWYMFVCPGLATLGTIFIVIIA